MPSLSLEEWGGPPASSHFERPHFSKTSRSGTFTTARGKIIATTSLCRECALCKLYVLATSNASIAKSELMLQGDIEMSGLAPKHDRGCFRVNC